jgi:hypothetical protein
MGTGDLSPKWGKDYIATAQFESLPLLRTAVIENRGKRFVVELPSHASAADRIALLDMRAQGFDIATRASSTH